MNTQNTTPETLKENLISEIEKLFSDKQNLSDIDIRYHLKDEDFENVEELEEILQDANAFDKEIIYYSNAIEYLRENDPSLRNSLELAHDMGYTADKLNSEILASILATDNARDEFREIENELEALIETYLEELEQLEEEEEEI